MCIKSPPRQGLRFLRQSIQMIFKGMGFRPTTLVIVGALQYRQFQFVGQKDSVSMQSEQVDHLSRPSTIQVGDLR